VIYHDAPPRSIISGSRTAFSSVSTLCYGTGS
jgi:hypothetical protein